MPRVLVVLTSFNHAAHLGESIDSVLGQTFSDFELVVLDDASRDHSWKLISEYTDPRLRAFSSRAPGEVVHRTNDAFSRTNSEYIALQHSDDVWKPEKLQRQVAYLDAHPEIGAVFTWVQVIDETGARVDNDWFDRHNQPRWAWLNELFNQKNTLNHPSALIRKRCYDEVGGYRYGLAQTDDADFWSRILVRHPIHVLQEKLTMHRIFTDKSNVSGDRPEVAVRSAHEWNFLRENLLALRDFDEIVRVFPDLEPFRREAGFNVKFLLAMACVRSPNRSAWPLGLDWMFELLNDKAQRDQLAELYAFTDLSFVKLSASLDSYLLESSKQLDQTVADYEAKVSGVLSEYATLQGVLSQRDIMLKDATSEYARNMQRLQDEYIEAAKIVQARHAQALADSERELEDLRLAKLKTDQKAAEAEDLVETERKRADAARQEAEAQSARADAARSEAQAQSARADSARAAAEAEGARAHASLAKAQAHSARADAAEREATQQRERALNIENQREAIAVRLAALESSSSWRATAPLRRLLVDKPRTAQTIRRAAKLVWWTARFQLLQKSREWRARRQAARLPATVEVVQPVPDTPVTAPVFVDDVSQVPEHCADALSFEKAQLSEWLQAAKTCLASSDRPALSHALLLRYFNCLELSTTTANAWIDLLEAPATQLPEKSEEFASLAASFKSYSRVGDFAAYLRDSPLFDPDFYRAQLLLEMSDTDAVWHYLLVGEPLGIYPSQAFDPSYYGKKYPDVTEAGMNCLFHYIIGGQREGRRATMPLIAHRTGATPIDPQKENVVLVVHETSRTGAPILGWNIAVILAKKYNVFSVLLGDGALTPDFEAISCETVGPLDGVHTAPLEAEFGLAPLFAGRAFKYAIVNSVESRVTVEVCAKHSVPTVLLVHEYGSYVWPASALGKALDMATEVVFPAASVARSSMQTHPPLRSRSMHIEAQGMSLLPSSRNETVRQNQDERIRALMQIRAGGAMIVTGAGSVNIRKGVDAFIGVAADVKRIGGAQPIHFLWVGGGYRPNDDMGYSVYLKEQMARSDVEDFITFIDEVQDLEPIYAMSDFFMLASRLDPLPNVSIDAAQRGIPTICFKEASGMADLLLADPDTSIGVVPYMDTRAAAEVILQLATDDPARARLSEATRRLAEAAFNMERYVQRLDRIGSAHSPSGIQRRQIDERTMVSA
ncbi:glycosyltransferase [Variovorax paradoxus]|uniref:glycosyltransferase n=1 Tax=Variovorax paradoxus TaxID=34073 RepID=UPI00069BE372|nr:glycosyltransferase [Variovorax paradoxus]